MSKTHEAKKLWNNFSVEITRGQCDRFSEIFSRPSFSSALCLFLHFEEKMAEIDELFECFEDNQVQSEPQVPMVISDDAENKESTE